MLLINQLELEWNWREKYSSPRITNDKLWACLQQSVIQHAARRLRLQIWNYRRAIKLICPCLSPAGWGTFSACLQHDSGHAENETFDTFTAQIQHDFVVGFWHLFGLFSAIKIII